MICLHVDKNINTFFNKDYVKHMQSHPVTCSICNMKIILLTSTSLERHMKSHQYKVQGMFYRYTRRVLHALSLQ